jgi:hypothetical protein
LDSRNSKSGTEERFRNIMSMFLENTNTSKTKKSKYKLGSGGRSENNTFTDDKIFQL